RSICGGLGAGPGGGRLASEGAGAVRSICGGPRRSGPGPVAGGVRVTNDGSTFGGIRSVGGGPRRSGPGPGPVVGGVRLTNDGSFGGVRSGGGGPRRSGPGPVDGGLRVAR